MPFNLRALAAKLLFEVIAEGRSLTTVLPAYKSQCTEAKDAAFLQSLAFGVLRHYAFLNVLFKQLVSKGLSEKDELVHYLLCLGFYQLKYMRVPHHAALSETVEAARVLHKPHLAGLVNAVLRNYLRKQAALDEQALEQEEARYLHPAWFIRKVKRAWPNDWQAVFQGNNEQAPLTIRVNTRLISVPNYLEALAAAGFEASVVDEALPAIALAEAQDVRQLPGFKEGWFYAQDVSAQRAVPLLSLEPGLRVLDVCAAPGGKTTHIVEAEPRLAEVVAVDNSAERSERIRENLTRMRAEVRMIVGDACRPAGWWDKRPFDRILVDVPCSAVGVIRRHPDIKWLRRERDIPDLVRQQLAILKSIWPLLKPAGILVYTTCSILPEENEGVIEAFLKTHPDAVSVPITMSLGKPQRFGHQILPGDANQDGFYYARLQKRTL